MKPSHFVCTAIIITVSLSATGCGGGNGTTSRDVDGAKVASTIEGGISEQLDLEMKVSCPDEIPGENGAKFKCTATSTDDDEFPVAVTQTNNRGNVDWDLSILPTEPVEQSIAGEIFSKRAIRVTLDCPVAVRLEPDYEFECTAEDDQGRTQTVYATVSNASGNVTWRT